MNEAETRAEHIDPALKAAGWGVVEGSRVLREHGITLGRLLGGGGRGARAKAEVADYVLVYRNTKLAVIEAKAWDKPYTEGVGQPKRYAAKLALRHAYASNGQAIYAIDMTTGAEGDVAGYPTPDELWAQTFADAEARAVSWRDRFSAVPFADKGFGREPLAEMQRIIEAENSDLFDVLAYVSFAAEPVSRADRAAAARSAGAAEFTDKQQAFVDFVLAQYVRQGVDELDAEKLSPLLRLKYQALSDAFAELGKPDQVRRVFVGFQRHLYAT